MDNRAGRFTLLIPDDFAGKPYEGGLNQMGHVIAGAAVVCLCLAFLPIWAGVTLAALLILALELWQRRSMGATLADYAIDMAYWITGVGTWAQVIDGGFQAGWGLYWPLIPVAAFGVEYVRISYAR